MYHYIGNHKINKSLSRYLTTNLHQIDVDVLFIELINLIEQHTLNKNDQYNNQYNRQHNKQNKYVNNNEVIEIDITFLIYHLIKDRNINICKLENYNDIVNYFKEMQYNQNNDKFIFILCFMCDEIIKNEIQFDEIFILLDNGISMAACISRASKISTDLITKIINSYIDINYKLSILSKIKNVICTPDIFKYALCYNITNIINLSITQQIKLDDYTILNSIKNDNKNKQVLQYLIDTNIADNKLLETICTLHYEYSLLFDLIKQCLNNKITPTQTAFNNLLIHYYNKYDRYYNHRKKYVNYNDLSSSDLINIIELFISFGYKITYDDIYKCIEYNFEIPNIERFNINIDSKFRKKCIEYNFFPYNIVCEYDIEYLCIECLKSSNIASIKKISKQVKPNKECLLNACSLTNNFTVINYLITEQNIEMDEECMIMFLNKNSIAPIIINSFNNYMLNKNINNEKIINEYKERIKYLEEKNDDYNKNIKNDIKINTINNNEIINNDNNNINDNNDNNNITQILFLLDLPINFDVTTEITVSKELIKLDFLKSLLNKKITYINFRRLLLDYIKTNNLLNKTIVTFTEHDKQIFKIPIAKIQFEHIDKFIYTYLL